MRKLRIGFLLVLFALIVGVYSYTAKAAKLQASKCSPATLERKNCILQRGAHHIQFRGETINSFDGVKRSLSSIPLVGVHVQWNRIEWKLIGKREFVEFEIWEAPKTQGELSSLRWFVFEVDGSELKQKLDKIIRRRKKVEGKKTDEMDKMRNYKLSMEKNGIHWKVDFETGVIQ